MLANGLVWGRVIGMRAVFTLGLDWRIELIRPMGALSGFCLAVLLRLPGLFGRSWDARFLVSGLLRLWLDCFFVHRPLGTNWAVQTAAVNQQQRVMFTLLASSLGALQHRVFCLEHGLLGCQFMRRHHD